MNYIIFDLEFTVLSKKQYMADILEIGAIKLSDEAGQLAMVDLFHSHVRPNQYRSIGTMTTKFTGITQEQVDQAPVFTHVMASFREWLNQGNNPYYLCSWGPDDKHQLLRHCTQHNVNMKWIRNYNDIQLLFTRLQGGDNGQRFGLKKALKVREISFFGKQHNALDDAFNTAKLFTDIFPQLSLEQNQVSDQPIYASSIVYSIGEEKNSPFGNLASLLGMVI
ncbi:3'-5' exonuclease [Paenibacillus anseongense]|uniref:3'-5' exonuclease n=1 Tax=Paenibacillus anseongense TaxID=2682845 RepID=UPI002DB7CD53|nr:3'-5' exonuclease [Paenibacillus anseongense]MEC0269724.1 exonuclease domain-containing protein [Paenibacillus anseongense]